eukprot:Sspe_Gene.102783::Locus_78625_Transcript_1_1_Confidence_1.000_Length_848::g.102783::m.102783
MDKSPYPAPCHVALFKALPREVIHYLTRFVAFEDFATLRLVSKGVASLCPDYGTRVAVQVRTWLRKRGRNGRSMLYLPRSMAITVDNGVTVGGVKNRLAAVLPTIKTGDLDGYKLVPHRFKPESLEPYHPPPICSTEADRVPLWALGGATGAKFYLVPPPVHESNPMSVLITPASEGRWSEFHHVSAETTIRALQDKMAAVSGSHMALSKAPEGPPLLPTGRMHELGLCKDSVLFEVQH